MICSHDYDYQEHFIWKLTPTIGLVVLLNHRPILFAMGLVNAIKSAVLYSNDRFTTIKRFAKKKTSDIRIINVDVMWLGSFLRF